MSNAISGKQDTKEGTGIMHRKQTELSEEKYVNSHSEELYELLIRLAKIPAPTGREERRAAFCRDWLTGQGAGGVFTDRAGNVVYPYHVREGKPLVIFMAHMDVVFPDLTELPLYERDGRVFCPGVGDDTANLAVLLMTAKFVAENRPDTGEYGFLLVCGVGEEGLGNLKGAREICAEYAEQTEAFYAFDLTMDSYTARAVGSLRYRISVQAQGGHSFHCFGNTNANVVLSRLILNLYQISVPGRGKTTYNVGIISGGTSVNTIAEHAEALYEIRSDEAADLEEMKQRFFETVQACEEAFRNDAAGIPEREESGRETAGIPERKESGRGTAGIPEQEESGRGTARISEQEECGRKTGRSRKAPVQINIELIGSRPCETEVDRKKRKQLFDQVEQAVKRVTGKVPEPVLCSTDCNIPLSLGIPSVCVGTCRGAGAHTREEYIERDSLADGLRIALELLRPYTANQEALPKCKMYDRSNNGKEGICHE